MYLNHAVRISTTIETLMDPEALFKLLLMSDKSNCYKFFIDKRENMGKYVFLDDDFFKIETNLRTFKIRKFQIIIDTATKDYCFSSSAWKWERYRG